MDISTKIAQMKQEPGFAENVGMVLIHNGVVRGWSRANGAKVTAIEITPDHARMEQIQRDIEGRDGIWKVVVEARQGILQPGDDVLFLIVAGDIRENVKLALSDLLDRIKSEAVTKREICE